MSRTIKFRAWDGKTMTYDIYSVEFSANAEVIMWFAGNYISGEHPTQPLMQFTGLKDRNGKEVYEGDIVSAGKPYDEKSIIVWQDYGFEFTWSKERTGSMPISCIGTIEVLGNIYEHPHLLEGRQT